MEYVELKPGTPVDHYTLVGQAGSGASGEVWQAVTASGGVAALKFLNVALLRSADAAAHRARFGEEARALETLADVPHVPALYGYNMAHPRPYLAMAYVDAPSWGALLADGEMLRVPLPRRLELLQAIAQTVCAIHARQIVHRDIKPTNIHGTETPYLIDFSVATTHTAARHTDENAVGTGFYMPPDGSPPDELADAYAFGVVAYEVVFGFHPIFPPGYVPATLAETRAEAAERLRAGAWSIPSELTDAKLPGNLRAADLPALDRAFRLALGPREGRFVDPTDLVGALREAVTVVPNLPYIDDVPEVVGGPGDIPAARDYTLHEVRKVQERTQHATPRPRRRPRVRWRPLLTAGLLVLGLLALFVFVFSLRG